jgi:hypothetical protein
MARLHQVALTGLESSLDYFPRWPSPRFLRRHLIFNTVRESVERILEIEMKRILVLTSVAIMTAGCSGSASTTTGYPGTRPLPLQVAHLPVVQTSPQRTVDSLPGNWVIKASMPTGLFYSAAAAHWLTIVYVAGGNLGNNTGVTDTVEAYDTQTDTWRTKRPMPTAREWPGAAFIDGIFYVVGGYAKSGLTNVL